uniref:Uncharacterized protein n=1 Tax=Nelumbo nucifera TaxID=4432 RepID=A0A822ZDS0_NELNU|nr:TPA_asm: hypothetical protein HUJ06_001502 [Nelumbo nucifera]
MRLCTPSPWPPPKQITTMSSLWLDFCLSSFSLSLSPSAFFFLY